MIERWKTTDAPVSHFLMNGGVLRVNDQDGFDSDYLQDQNKLFVVEKRTDQFKFFVDLDYKAAEELSSLLIIELAVQMNQITKHKCYIARTDIRVVDGQIKTGVHFHWPDLIVNKQEAIKLRNQIVHKNPGYREFIDESVYIGSGLRLVWSYKMQGSVIYQPYIPWKSVTVEGLIENLPNEKTPQMLRFFTIRVQGTSQDQEIKAETTELEKFINKYIPGQKDARVLKLFLTRDGETIGAQTDSKFCANINKAHQRNHIWFWIRDGMLYQMCLDPDCKNFEKGYYLPPSILKQINVDKSK
jgi:Prim-pol 4/Herpesviridae UL52/UL70 DNA primase